MGFEENIKERLLPIKNLLEWDATTLNTHLMGAAKLVCDIGEIYAEVMRKVESDERHYHNALDAAKMKYASIHGVNINQSNVVLSYHTYNDNKVIKAQESWRESRALLLEVIAVQNAVKIKIDCLLTFEVNNCRHRTVTNNTPTTQKGN